MTQFYPSHRTFGTGKSELPIAYSEKANIQHTIFGVNPKSLSLIVLVIQNSLLVLMMRYSRTIQTPEQPMYIASTAVFMAEIIKIVSSFVMLYHQEGSMHRCRKMIRMEILNRPREVFKVSIPSGLYAIQNNLLYIALSNLEAATFQVTYQLKILSTAIFSVYILGRSLNRNNWLALILLMLGVTLVQMESVTSLSRDTQQQQPLIGLIAVLSSCISSGFAGCYLEKIFKTSTTSMWIRNIQVALCGSFFSFCAMVISDSSLIMSSGFFQGYTVFTWLVVLNQALGGLLISLVVKYADNILKGFATSISIILSGVISFYLFDFQPSLLFMAGTGIVIAAIVLYGSKSK